MPILARTDLSWSTFRAWKCNDDDTGIVYAGGYCYCLYMPDPGTPSRGLRLIAEIKKSCSGSYALFLFYSSYACARPYSDDDLLGPQHGRFPHKETVVLLQRYAEKLFTSRCWKRLQAAQVGEDRFREEEEARDRRRGFQG
jgi:hypothetical protein